MKKKLLGLFLISICFLVGCGNKSEKNIIKDASSKIGKLNSYYLEGEMTIINNEDTYTYDVNVSYQKNNNFKVNLKNRSNEHEQIILRNKEGVYVITPSLNKSFKFQSEWPYNSSQTYLLQTLLKDIENDEEYKFKQTDNGYMIETKANYSANKDLSTQKLYFDKNKTLNKVEVFDTSGNLKITMNIEKIEYNKNFDDNDFKLNSNMNSSTSKQQVDKTIDQVIYPMYMPQNTHLSSENKVSKENGERIIMTFSGDSSFMLIQETANISDKNSVVSVNGEPYMLIDTIGNVTDNSVEWISNGIEYYLLSDKLTKDELLSVAKSLSVMPVGK